MKTKDKNYLSGFVGFCISLQNPTRGFSVGIVGPPLGGPTNRGAYKAYTVQIPTLFAEFG